MAELKRTGLYPAHLRSKAKIVPFAGWEMPVQYSSIKEEHTAVRTAAGIFDVSHMGEILFSGPDAMKNVQYLVSNDVVKIKPSRVIYTGLLTPQGTFVDDLLVYKFSDDKFLLCVNASNVAKDYQWMLDHLQGDVSCKNVSDQYTQIAVQGPNTLEILKPLTKTDLSKIKYYRFEMGQVAGIDTIISRTGYTGEYGFELYFDPAFSMQMWDALIDSGKSYGLTPTGLGCRDTLRLEAGMALYGNDIDSEHTAFEAGLQWTVKMNKEDFIGKAALQSQIENGLTRHLVGFELTERGIPRHGYQIYSGDQCIGEVTSGTMSITLGKPIGMGYVTTGFEKIGTPIQVKIREKMIKGKTVALPFYSRTR